MREFYYGPEMTKIWKVAYDRINSIPPNFIVLHISEGGGSSYAQIS